MRLSVFAIAGTLLFAVSDVQANEPDVETKKLPSYITKFLSKTKDCVPLKRKPFRLPHNFQSPLSNSKINPFALRQEKQSFWSWFDKKKEPKKLNDTFKCWFPPTKRIKL